MFTERRLLSEAEAAQVLEVAADRFPFAQAMGLADSIHVHVNVDSLSEVVQEETLARAAKEIEQNEVEYKIEFASGVNVIFATEATAQDELIEGAVTSAKPYVDHFGIDLRDESDSTRRVFDGIPALAETAGWRHVFQDGPVNCCHVVMGPKHWVYPPGSAVSGGRPVEFAFGQLTESDTYVGCDYRPIDPAHPLADRAADIDCSCEPNATASTVVATPAATATTSATPPKKVYIFEECTCNSSPSASLLGLLASRYPTADVRAFDLAKPEGLVPLPPTLFMQLQENAAAALPAIVVDGQIRSQGWTPNFMDAVKLVESPDPAGPVRRAQAAGECCGTDGSCC
ncbi:hypothetical protein [Amycolatopsis sp. NPDC051071]|uniref:hypothetical protein n=1 Tax=Amycolatopsis sp. NPDC051071 TaxID=3154637 RepID=UPI003439B366